MTANNFLRFDYEDSGNCRVYYRESRRRYCFQKSGAGFILYVCSRDGEPDYDVPLPHKYAELCATRTYIGQELHSYLRELS